MRLFGWFRRAAQTDQDSGPVSRRWIWLGGRRMLGGSLYVMPKDKAEGARLDLQHHLLKIALGRNYYPRLRSPRTILDVACGTGIWGREMALAFPKAQIIGFDIDRTPLEASQARLGPGGQFPPNFSFREADALQPFPFNDETFDFTHARLIGPFVPISRWPDVVAEMVRVTKRGGYVEIVEGAGLPTSTSQAYTTLTAALVQLTAARGLHPGAGAYLADYLRQAGLQQVQEKQVFVGKGRQAERQQRLLAADLLAGFTNLQPIITKAGIIPDSNYSPLLEQARSEVAEQGVTMPITFAFGLRT